MTDRPHGGSPMIRKLPSATLVAALAGVLALAGCNKADDTNDAAIDTTPPPAATTPADTTMPPATTDTTATTGLSITSVDLGSAVGDDNRISVPPKNGRDNVCTPDPNAQLVCRTRLEK